MSRAVGLGLLAGLCLLATSACTSGLSGKAKSAAPAPEITCSARARLDALRAASTRRKQDVQLELSAPFMPSAMRARGGVAMDPEHGDLRMILVGPGGATAIDLWMHDTAYRFEVPAIGKTLKGDARTPAAEKKGLPVDFLAWWMLHPLRGEVLVAEERDGDLSFVLRDRRGGASTYVDGKLLASGRFEATRTTWSGDEKIDEETLVATSMTCGRVEYSQASTSVRVVAECEKESADVPDRAFVEPAP